MTVDRRQWPRIRLGLELQLRFDSVESVLEAARTIDISRKGLFLAMDPPRPVGTPVRISFVLTAPRTTLELAGVVVRHSEIRERLDLAAPSQTGVGVELTDPPVEWLQFCDRLLDEQLRAFTA